MSQENVELVAAAFEAYNAGGIEAVLPLCPPDVVMYPFPEWVEDAVYRGHDGVRRLVNWLEEFDRPRWDVHELRAADSRVLARCDLVARTNASSVPIRQPWAVICSGFRGHMIGEWRWFQTWRDALDVAGLEE
jgi:hypothetical protein